MCIPFKSPTGLRLKRATSELCTECSFVFQRKNTVSSFVSSVFLIPPTVFHSQQWIRQVRVCRRTWPGKTITPIGPNLVFRIPLSGTEEKKQTLPGARDLRALRRDPRRGSSCGIGPTWSPWRPRRGNCAPCRTLLGPRVPVGWCFAKKTGGSVGGCESLAGAWLQEATSRATSRAFLLGARKLLVPTSSMGTDVAFP